MSKGKSPLLWTNDDLGRDGAESLRRMVEFLGRYKVPGSFATVPVALTKEGPRFIDDDAALRDEIAKAQSAGHEFFQHGTTHVCIEYGMSDPRMYHAKLMGHAEAREVTRQRPYYERFWTLEAIKAQIEWGRDAWIRAFGEPSKGFRPGCGCTHRNLFAALEELDFDWVSSDLVSFTGWMWTVGEFDTPHEMEPPVRPYMRTAKLMEFPILDDFAFRFKPDQVDRFVELGLAYWNRCVEEGWPFIVCSHWHGLEANHDTGYRVHERLLDTIMGSGRADPMTLGEYHRKLLAGEYPLDPPEVLNPPDPPGYHVWHFEGKR